MGSCKKVKDNITSVECCVISVDALPTVDSLEMVAELKITQIFPFWNVSATCLKGGSHLIIKPWSSTAISPSLNKRLMS